MKWKLINQYEPYTDILEQVLKNRKITNINYLNLDNTSLLDPYLLDNIDLASDLLIQHCNLLHEILIIVDSDCDGYTSAATLYNYIIIAFPKMIEHIHFYIHDSKIHGIPLKEELLQYQLICVPDAGTNDLKQQAWLNDHNVDIIILDHHEAESDIKCNSKLAIVNNQTSINYTNKMISGVGVVYKFLKIVDKKINGNFANIFLDLVAVGMAADMQSIWYDETAYLIREGLKKENIHNPFLTTLINNSSFTIDKNNMNYITVSFYIAPLINAVTRVGTLEEKRIVFSSMLFDYAYRLVSNPKKLGGYEPLVEQAYRLCVNLKNRQKRLKDQGTTYIKSLLENYDDNNKAIILNIDNKLDEGLVGLIANEIAGEYHKPVVLIRNNIGHMRGYDKSELKNFKILLEECNDVDWVRGHANAGGTKYNNDNVEPLIQELNEKLKDIDFSNSYDIDYIIEQNCDSQWLKNQILKLYKVQYIWGRGCEEPLILFKDFNISNKDINLLKRNTLKINLNGIYAIKFHISDYEYEELIKHNNIKINIIGYVTVNEWNGIKQPQIKIVDYQIEPIRKFIY